VVALSLQLSGPFTTPSWFFFFTFFFFLVFFFYFFFFLLGYPLSFLPRSLPYSSVPRFPLFLAFDPYLPPLPSFFSSFRPLPLLKTGKVLSSFFLSIFKVLRRLPLLVRFLQSFPFFFFAAPFFFSPFIGFRHSPRLLVVPLFTNLWPNLPLLHYAFPTQ